MPRWASTRIHRGLLLKLWLFGAIKGVYSGREIARQLRWDLRFRYLAGGLHPDFRTINRFRASHREDFAEVFRQTVRTARASGLGKLGRVAIDGSEIRANTSRHKAMSHGRMEQAEEQLEEEIAQILAQMDEVNEVEDDEHGDDDGDGGLPAELQSQEQRVAKLRAVRQQLEAERGSELRPSSQKSFADPDANMMRTGEGSLQYCYNAQIATSEDGVIVAAEVTTSPRDVGQLVPMVEAVKANTGRRPGVLARGRANIRGEWNLVCAAANALTIYRAQGMTGNTTGASRPGTGAGRTRPHRRHAAVPPRRLIPRRQRPSEPHFRATPGSGS